MPTFHLRKNLPLVSMIPRKSKLASKPHRLVRLCADWRTSANPKRKRLSARSGKSEARMARTALTRPNSSPHVMRRSRSSRRPSQSAVEESWCFPLLRSAMLSSRKLSKSDKLAKMPKHWSGVPMTLASSCSKGTIIWRGLRWREHREPLHNVRIHGFEHP